MLFLPQDVSILVALYAVYPAVPRLLVVPWILVTGFFMWCLFVVGHDCGHSTFSPYPLLNSIIGNLSHGFLGVPFQPWANSHAVHHRYHQHVEWDVSHPWFIEDHYEPRTRFELVLYWIPLLAYHLYLIGVGDGSHFVPWVGSIGLKDGVKSKAVHRGDLRDWISTASALAIPAAFWYLWAQGSWSAFFVGYLCPLMIFNAWLTIVTYLQHHSESVRAWKDTFSGSDSKAGWTFAAGALETVDRTYGWPIDDLSHNITDAHLVHHLFAREIPHYRLREATDAIAAAGVAKGHKRVEEIPYVGFILSYYKILWACRLMVKGANEAEYVPVAMGGKKAQ
ncbi:fatty acid desaturase [Hyaloraphidium curvatum]|nr:fatty acid desaturase [Hyaloraphidium curvatum]